LESLFIDEGFGTLDTEETLGSVAQALENLHSGNRLAGIVTRLKGLADRLRLKSAWSRLRLEATSRFHPNDDRRRRIGRGREIADDGRLRLKPSERSASSSLDIQAVRPTA